MQNTPQASTVNFHGHNLITIMHNNEPHVAMKPICEQIGLDWKTQHRKITTHPALSPTVHIMTIVAKDGKNREQVFIPIKYLNGWLFTIDANRVKLEIKDTVILYQRECFDALYQYWTKGVAVNPRVDSISEERIMDIIKNEVGKRVNEIKEAVFQQYEEKFNALKHEILKKNHLWQQILICKGMGYETRRIAKSVNRDPSTVRKHVRRMKKCGIIEEYQNMPLFSCLYAKTSGMVM